MITCALTVHSVLHTSLSNPMGYKEEGREDGREREVDVHTHRSKLVYVSRGFRRCSEEQMSLRTVGVAVAVSARNGTWGSNDIEHYIHVHVHI